MINYKIVLQILLFVCILTTGNVLWKFGLVRIGGFLTEDKTFVNSIRELLLSWEMWLGGVFYVGGTLYWFTILSRENLSYVYPMVSIGYILTSIMGVIFFNETISSTGWIGMGIVSLGFVVLSIK